MSLLVIRAGILEKPLLVTDKASSVEVFADDGSLRVVMHKVLGGDTWAVTSAADPDWNEALAQLGYAAPMRLIQPGG